MSAFYEYTDKVIELINKRLITLFSRLSILRNDEINVLNGVRSCYADADKYSKKLFLKLASDTYRKEYKGKKKKDVGMDWLLLILNEYDPVTGYKYTAELERKRDRLAEELLAISSTKYKQDWLGKSKRKDKQSVIDKGKKALSSQMKHEAEHITDEAQLQAFRDMGVKEVQWLTEGDERVCYDCKLLNGLIFKIDEVPSKPHVGCRCRLRAIIK